VILPVFFPSLPSGQEKFDCGFKNYRQNKQNEHHSRPSANYIWRPKNHVYDNASKDG